MPLIAQYWTIRDCRSSSQRSISPLTAPQRVLISQFSSMVGPGLDAWVVMARHEEAPGELVWLRIIQRLSVAGDGQSLVIVRRVAPSAPNICKCLFKSKL